MPVDSAEVGGYCDTWPWSYRLLMAPISMQLLINCSNEGGISGECLFTVNQITHQGPGGQWRGNREDWRAKHCLRESKRPRHGILSTRNSSVTEARVGPFCLREFKNGRIFECSMYVITAIPYWRSPSPKTQSLLILLLFRDYLYASFRHDFNPNSLSVAFQQW